MKASEMKQALALAREAALGRAVVELVRSMTPRRGRPAADAPKKRGRPRKADAAAKPRAPRKPRASKDTAAPTAATNGSTTDSFGRDAVEGLD